MHPDHQPSRPPTPARVVAPRPGPGASRRSALRRFAEVRGLVGGFSMPHEPVRLRTSDGVTLAASHLPGPPRSPAVVLVHGFAAHRRKPAYAYLADVLARAVTVLTVDLRGHGQSAGRSTLGGNEALDVEAAVDWLRAHGQPWVGAVGVSMGATSVANALGRGVALDAAIAVSAPAHLHPEPRTDAMRRLHTLWTSPPHRAAFRAVTGVRVVHVDDFSPPLHPAEVIPRAGVPTLLVHGEDDHFFDIAEWESIATSSDVPLWREPPGFGHAEDGVTPEFAEALARAILQVHRTGRFPERDQAWDGST